MLNKTSKKILVLDNNTGWNSWNEKIQQIKDFYGELFDLSFVVIHTEYKNVPVVEQPLIDGSSGVNKITDGYIVDQVWFEKNPDVLTGQSFDCVVFVLLAGDISPQTGLIPAGVNTGSFNGINQITVFIQPNSENWQAEQSGIVVGNSFAFILCHELSHWFYPMLKLAIDNTHLYFYSTNPAGILADFKKVMTNTQTASSISIYNQAKICLGESLVPIGDDPDLGCAISVSVLWGKIFPNSTQILNTTSTASLLAAFIEHTELFMEVTEIEALPGDFIIAATGTSSIVNTPITHGHCGVVAKYGVCSNNSLTGLWDENYTLQTWKQRYEVQGGYQTRYFRTK